MAYEDDVVLMVKDENGRLMVRELQKYVKEKDLCVNVEETKVGRFGKKEE